MRPHWLVRHSTCALLLFLSEAGHAAAGAPSYPVFGAFFPAWLLCGIIGIAAAVLARASFVATKLVERIPAQLFVCMAIGIIVASSFWLLLLGP